MGLVNKLFATAVSVANYPLRSRSRLGAVWEFGIRQVAARMVEGDIAVNFPNGTQLVVPPRMKGAAHFISPGLCEFEQMSFVSHFLRPGDLFVDVGANLGAYTLLASGVAGANALAIEPCRSTFKSLERTLALNGITHRAIPHHIALGAEPGVLRLTEELGTENYLSTTTTPSPGAKQAEVSVSTLDLLTRDDSPTFVKIDVEGFETAVIAGARESLQRDCLEGMVIERTGNGGRYGFDEDTLHCHIQSLGFKPFTYAPFKRELIPLATDALGNIIYLKSSLSAAARLKEAQPFEFRGFRI